MSVVKKSTNIANTKTVDLSKRDFLTKVTVGATTVGAACAVVPFLSSWQPNKKAKEQGGPKEIDISGLKNGELKIVEWRGKPIWILKRTPDMIEKVKNFPKDLLRDPQSNDSIQPKYAKNELRSQNKDILVLIGICTHFGCSPLYKPNTDSAISNNWNGGFFCPCHGSKFDLAGRVFTNVPATSNLEIPAYSIEGDKLIIGSNPGEASV